MWNLLPQKLHACSTPFCLFPTGLVRAEMIRRDRDPSSSECVSSQSISQQFTVWSALGSSHSLSLDGTSCATHLHHNWRQGAQRWPWNSDQTMTKQPLGFRGRTWGGLGGHGDEGSRRRPMELKDNRNNFGCGVPCLRQEGLVGGRWWGSRQ